MLTSPARSAPSIDGWLRTLVQQLVRVGQRVSGEHAGLHRAEAAQVPHHRAGVDARDADDALPDEFVLERAGGAPVRRPRRRVAHRVAGDPDLVAAALGVLVVPAGVADLRRRGHHDLPVVAGVGERLLVAGHAGGEHRLAERLPDGAERGAGEDPAVLEHQHAPCSTSRRLLLQPLRVHRARSSPRNPVSISVPDGSRHRMARMPSWVSALPAMPRLGADRGDRVVGYPDRTGHRCAAA